MDQTDRVPATAVGCFLMEWQQPVLPGNALACGASVYLNLYGIRLLNEENNPYT